MEITRRSPFSGQVNTMNIDVTYEQMIAHANGGLIQDVFPELTPDERAFIMTGITPDEWEDMFDEG